MQEADHGTTYDKTITTPNAQYALADARKRTQDEIQTRRKIIRYQEDEKTMITREEEKNNWNGIKDHLSAP